LRPEKQNERNDPEPDGNATIGGNGWKYIQVKNRDDKKQNEVTLAEHPL
jgi:hypothetical protein